MPVPVLNSVICAGVVAANGTLAILRGISSATIIVPAAPCAIPTGKLAAVGIVSDVICDGKVAPTGMSADAIYCRSLFGEPIVPSAAVAIL